MADALSAVHAAGVVLRDFKSANVMLVGFDRTRAIITDFGLAQALPCERERKSFRSERATVGTIDYMAPEQIRGGTVTPAADMYAFGVVMYEMVTGQRPFIGTSVAEIALRHLNESPLPPHELAPNLDDKWDNVILGCLRKKPSERFSSPSSVKDAILAFA
jgi:serine/threonine protein kinase